MPLAPRPGKSALDEFLPELNVPLNNRDLHVDPRELQLDSLVGGSPVVAVEFSTTSPEPLQIRAVTDNSVQWWPMFAAALVGIGVSLLALGAWARFGQF